MPQLPPFPSPTGGLTSFLVCLLFTPSRRGQRGSGARCGPGRAPASSPRPAAALRQQAARSPGLFPLPSPKTPSGAFLLPLPFVFPVCSPDQGLPPLSAACYPGGGGNRRRNKETNFGEAMGRPSQPACCGAGGGVGVSRGFLVGLSLRVGPVPLLRVGPAKVGKAPRVSLRKCIKNRCRGRVCLKSGCGSTPGHFRLSSTALYQSPDDCDK